MQILIYILELTLIFFLLSIITERYFLSVLEKVGKKLSLSSEALGSTLMAVGSSAPELLTSLFAVLRAESVPSLGAGTIVGSAIFNILVITGSALLVKRARLISYPILRDLIFYAAVIGVLLLVFLDQKITFAESLGLTLLYLIYLYLVKIWKNLFKYQSLDLDLKEESKDTKNPLVKTTVFLLDPIFNLSKNLIYQFGLSILLIGVSTHFLVETAILLAESLQISPAIIGLTVLAAGTSIPDLLSSVFVARKGYPDAAITNGIGSNIFDILVGLGVPYLIFFLLKGVDKTIPIVSYNIQASIALLFFTTFVTLFIFIIQRWRTKRRSGAFLILIYLIYILYLMKNL